MTTIKQFDIWIADLNPRIGTESGKVRPVLIVQTDLLNAYHPSIVICPITTNIYDESEILRVHLKKGVGGVSANCSIMIDQIRAIDTIRLKKKIGTLPIFLADRVKENLKIILDLD
ncbi:MAG: type II toxin-antitoxin system PemK/MazF family toxin [Ignavibacteria bacterium CG_4_8_14_3_um_filter_37_9]|nr:type II toxin-antitoxin system PemK/MazF family toxin [Ignavibacteria bacterium]PIP77539.1 MAG: taxon MazF [Ignavibacteria bacterium CG22_combo_CG10-13_8_21_14_all_37_15]PIW99182.1 MAG: type II toxin-antitoxin system PemK/MazF family toxin [Ignavibacteria bacterium CG_4_8_14_3_um_filter_37_9]PIX93486.1 MAG: type II toxin-antitoxin system PemK/MazF family toxin [Ignavibacteria bacterium CG_4_10_14_3_um_filter_37_18]PJC58091.1 MAG: type II toxin-antitoxin system PemK/MazF family toxin [Ignavib